MITTTLGTGLFAAGAILAVIYALVENYRKLFLEEIEEKLLLKEIEEIKEEIKTISKTPIEDDNTISSFIITPAKYNNYLDKHVIIIDEKHSAYNRVGVVKSITRQANKNYSELLVWVNDQYSFILRTDQVKYK